MSNIREMTELWKKMNKERKDGKKISFLEYVGKFGKVWRDV